MKFLYFILLTCISCLTHTQEQDFIDTIKLQNQTITYFVNQEFHTTYLRDNLFVTYQDDIDLTKLDYTIITMPLIMNTIAMIWVSGQDYTIKAMDKDLFNSLNIVREVFKRFYPATKFHGNLIPKQLVDNTHIWHKKIQPKRIALPFSHGLDSLCTSLRLRNTPQLLITARGYPDTPLGCWNKNWEYTKNINSHFAKIHGHTTTFITSNFHEFFNWAVLGKISPEIDNWRVCMIEGLGWMGLAAPILITKGYATFVLPANNDWKTPHPGADCPLVVENITFAGVTNISEGFDLSRMEKNKVIAQICNKDTIEKPVCMICEKILENRKNCCKCLKCVLSILAFLLLDENPQEYGFDINITDFCNFLKTSFIEKYVYEDYSADWFKYCQQESYKQFNQLSPELQKFFTWYNSIDFDARTIPSAQIVLNYNDFTDLYTKIPQDVLIAQKK